MKIMKKQWNKRMMTMLSVFAAAAMMIGYATPVHAADKTYKVTFKAGAKGTISGGSSYDKTASYKETINVDSVKTDPESGYYFTGWSPETPESGQVTITKRTTFVAQYAKIIDEAVYRVNYIDTYGNAVATQKVVTSNAGARVTETAAPAENFAADALVKSATVAKDGTTEITFVYTSTLEPDVTTETETVVLPGGTTVTVLNGGGTAATAAGGTTGGNAAQPAGQNEGTGKEGQEQPVVEAPDEATPLANQNLEDNNKETEESKDEKVPLADKKLSSNMWVYGVAGVVLLIAVAGAVYAYKKRRR